MALPSTNITTTAVRTEIGSASNIISVLVGAAGLNKFSFYAPGALSITGTTPNKILVLTPVSSNYKLGDFRRYDHGAPASGPPSSTTNNYGPGGTTTNFDKTWHPRTLNIKAISGYDDYVTFDFYKTETDRTNRTNLWHTQTYAISYQSISGGALSGHTRNQTEEPVSSQLCAITSFPVATLTTPDHIIKAECYISTSAGARILCLGTARSDGYFDVTLHKYSNPIISGTSSQDIASPPSPFTHVFPRCYSANTPACSIGDITQSEGSGNYQFWVKAWGPKSGGGNAVAEVTSCNVVLNLNGTPQTVATGVSLGYTNGNIRECYGTLSGSRHWAYDDVATVTLTSVVFGSNKTDC